MAAHQRGLVTREQLRELGFSRRVVERLIRDGWLQPIHHNVYAVGHRHLTDRGHLLAALLTFGSCAFLSHRTAAAVWKLRAINLHELEVTVPGTGGRTREGLTVHRTHTPPDADEIRTHGELRVSSVPRMLVELAGREKPAELERLVTVAVQRRLLPLHRADARERLEAALARHGRHPGMGALRESPSLAAVTRADGQLRLGITPLRFTDFRVEHDARGILGDVRHFLKLS